MSIKNSKKDFLKLLARTSVVAMTALSAGNAMAGAARVTQQASPNQNATDNVGANFVPNGAFHASDDWIKLGDADHNIMINTADSFKGIDLDTKVATGTLTITQDADGRSMGSIGNGGVGAALKLVLEDGAGAYSYTLTGSATDAVPAVAVNTYVGLGDITIGNNATLNFNSGGETTFTGAIDGSAAGQGTITTNAQKVNFNGKIGNTNTLAKISAGDGEIVFGDTVAATTIEARQGKVTFKGDVTGNVHLSNDGAEIALTDGVNVTGNIDNIGNDNKGTLTIQGASTVTGTVGAGKALAAIGTAGKAVTFTDSVKANTITTAAGAVTFKGDVTGNVNLGNTASVINMDDTVKITGAVDNTSGTANKGKLNFAGVGEATGNVGATNAFEEINLNGAGAVTFGGTIVAKGMNLNNAGAILTLNKNTTIGTDGIKGSKSFADGGGGTVQIADSIDLTSAIGTDAKAIGTLQITDAMATLTLKGDGIQHYIGSILPQANNKNIIIVNGNQTINSNIGKPDEKFLSLSVMGAKTFTLGGDLYTKNGVKFDNAAATLKITKNDSTILKLDGDGGTARGVIEIDATGVSLGSIGSTKTLNQLKLNANKSVTITDDAAFETTGIRFGTGSTLTLTKDKSLTLTNADIDAGAVGDGTLVLNGHTITSKIGNTNPIGTIKVDGGTVTLKAASKAIEVQPGTNVTDAKLKLEGDLTVGTNATRGKVGALAEVDFHGDHTLQVESDNLAVFDPLLVTTNTANEGTIKIISKNSLNIPTNFSTAEGNKLKKLHLSMTGKTDTEYSAYLKGNVINVGEIHLETPNAGAVKLYGYSLGSGFDKSYNPQIIIGDFKGTKGAAADVTALEIRGHTFIEGSATPANKIDVIAFREAGKNLYITGDVPNIAFATDANLYTINGDTTFGTNIQAPEGSTSGSIIASAATANEARAAFVKADQNYDITAKPYENTLEFKGQVGVHNVNLAGTYNETSRLKLIDAGNGTVHFNDLGALGGGQTDVRVNKIKAKIIKFSTPDGIYDINDIDDGLNSTLSELIIAGNTELAKNSRLLGTSGDPLHATVSFDGGAQRTLTLQDNVHINVKEGLELVMSGESGGNKHKINFTGNSDVYSQLGKATSLFETLSVTPGAAGQKVTFHKDVNTQDGISLANANATAIIEGDIVGGVHVVTDTHGTLYLSGSNKTIDAIGKTVAVGGADLGLGTVIMNTDKSKVAGLIHTDTLRFDTDGELTVQNNAAFDVAIKANEDNIGTLIVEGGDYTISTNAGEKNYRLKALKMGANNTKFTIANAVVLNTNILGSSVGIGTVEFAGTSVSPNLDIASEGAEIAAVNFGGAVTLRDAYATNINVNANAVSLRKAHGITNLTAGGNATILDGGYVKARGAGTLTIAGNATIDEAGIAGNALGTLSAETNGTVATLNTNDVYSAAFNHKYATVTAPKVTVHGAYTATDATLETAGTFKVTGKTTLAGKVQVNDSSKGLVLDLSDSGATVTNLTALNILFDGSKGSSLTDGRTIISFDEDMTDHAFTKVITLSSNNPLFGKVSLDTSAGKLGKLKVENTISKAVKNVSLPAGQKSALETIFLANINNSNFTNDLAYAPASEGGFSNAARRFGSTESSEAVSNEVISLMTQSADLTTQRISHALTDANIVPSARIKAEMQGVAAGDSAERFGAWANVLGGTSRQGSRKHASGFSSSNVGGLVGADTMLSDKFIIGFAMGNAQSSTKFKDFKTGDKIKSSSWVFTGYGSYNVTDTIFVRTALTGASTKVNASDKRIGQQTGIAYAKGKYNVEAFNLEAAVGYNHKTNAGTFTPYVGINLGRVNDINYVETGAGIQNREVKQNASHSKSVIAGAAFATRSNWDDMEILPEAHVNLRYGVGTKTPKGQYKIVGTNSFANYAGEKPSNLSVNVGGSVTSYVDNIEYGVGYDAHLADKYVGHQGSLKIKVKF